MKRLASVATIATMLLLAAGCNSSTGTSTGAKNSTQPQASQGITELHVALIPSADEAPFYVAIQKGFFSSRGLKVTPEPLQNGAAITAAVTSGSAQIGVQALSPTVTAVSKGVPIKAFAGDEDAPRPATPTSPYGDVVILVRKNSSIKTAADLNGKTVAVNALRAGVELAVRGAVDNSGGNSATLKLLPLPFPNMGAALASHRVDAMAALEPFVHAAIAKGDRVLLDAFPYAKNQNVNFLASVWFTSAKYASAQPDVLTKFRDALAEADAYVKQTPSEIARIVPTYTSISTTQAKEIWTAHWSAIINPQAYAAEIDLMVKYKFIDKQLPLSQFATPAATK